jgi:putative restriction endonuclease
VCSSDLPYDTRDKARIAGLHAHEQAGISGTASEGADAIVLNGGYPDDHDDGDVIIYTGHGGQNQRKQQIADQSLDDTGNAGLVRSQLEGLPIRVIRGFEEKSKYAPTKGYRYDGLYRVVRHWFKTRDDGFRVLQFRMVKIGSPSDIEDIAGPAPDDHAQTSPTPGPAGRTETTVNRVDRKARVVRNVKKWHENRCQICGLTVELPNGPASQVAHIQGLGIPHNGPDHETNALCLCPNDHIRFDNGALYLTDDLNLVDALTGTIVSPLRTHKKHRIGIEYVRQHRGYWSKDS